MARLICSAFADEAAQSLTEQIAACKANGIGAIELRGVDGNNCSDITVEQAKELKATLDAAGITVSAVGSKYGKEPFNQEAFRQTVEVATVLEAPYIRMFSFYEGSREEIFANVKAMADLAYENGILCCHENEKKVYGETPERCKELIDHVGSERLGCVFDFANFMECGVDPMEAYALLKPYITYFHIKDYSKAQQMVVPAGRGDGRLAEILADYDQSTAGCVVLSMEPHLRVFEGLGAFDEETKQRLEAKTLFASQAESFACAAEHMHQVIAQAQPIALGIIGYGNMGGSHMSMHLRGEHQHMRITAVADINPARLEAAKEALPGVALFDSAEALLESGSCNAVVIATPHYDHPPIAIKALELGLHVMTEKPAGVYTKQVRAMNEAAERANGVFAIMFNQRSKPLHQMLRNLVQGGQYGEMKRVIWIICDWYRTQAYYNSGGWRATWAGEGGGVLLNQCPHNLDLWQWICGMPSKIRASCHEGKWHSIEVEDDVTIYAEYPNGATGTFITTTGEPAGSNYLEITLDKAKITCQNDKIIITELEGSTQAHIDTAQQGFGSLGSKQVEPDIPALAVRQHAQVLNGFAKAITTGDRSALYAAGEEGIRSLSISNAAYLSAWLGKEIDLPLDEDLYWAELQKKIAGSKAKEAAANTVAADMERSFR